MLALPGLHGWIQQLPEPVRDAVLAATRPREVAAGEAVYELGAAPNACYLIERGRVRICNFTESGKEVSMGELLPGDCLGEVGMIDSLPRFNTAVAVEDSRLLVLMRADFERLYDAHPEIARQLNRQLAYRLRLIYMQAEEANALSLGQRLARTLARLGYSAGVAQEGGDLLVQPVSHEALAHMLGATRQAVSQEMKRLERAELIRISYGKVFIRDIEALMEPVEALIGGEPVVSTYPPPPERS
jgi:CRP-like cAMP-binding protein